MKFRHRSQVTAATSAPLPGPRKTPVRWIILSLLFAISATSYFYMHVRVSAEGLVIGNFTNVTPLFEAHVDEMLVPCNSYVKTGLPLLALSNPVLALQYAEDFTNQPPRRDLINKVKSTKAQLDVLRTEKQLAEALYQETHERLQVLERLYQQDAISKPQLQKGMDANTQAKEGLNAALARISAQQALLDEVKAEAAADSKQEEAFSSRDNSRSEASAKLMADLTLRAPREGVLLNCKINAGDIVKPGVPIFQIFDPKQAYLEAYVPASDAIRIKPGMSASIHLRSSGADVKGKVVAAEPVVVPLPEALRRYFWQDPQWSQYTPVRIAIDPSTSDAAQILVAGSVIDVSISVATFWPR